MSNRRNSNAADERKKGADKGSNSPERVAAEIPAGMDRSHVWAFSAGHRGRKEFRGNPKYLFLYVNLYRPDITAWWMSGSEEVTEEVRSLGFRVYTLGTAEAELAMNKTGVLVDEQVRTIVPKGLESSIYLNLYHGVGAKYIERSPNTGILIEELARKYILSNTYYRNRQLFLCPSPMMEEDFRAQCGIDEDKVVRAGYPRNLYQRYYERIATFDHDLLRQKGLPEDWNLAVYAPTFRKNAQKGTVFASAIPDPGRLIETCRRNHILLIFKMHPLMEKEVAYLLAAEQYKDSPYLYFWDNRNDFYEIIDRIDLAIIDYSSIYTDFLEAGVLHFIRYVYDYETETKELRYDYEEVTSGRECFRFDELLDAIDSYREADEEGEEKRRHIRSLYWEYSGEDSFERIIQAALDFHPQDRVFPTLHSYDVFDTLISRRCLDPKGVFYHVREEMACSGLNFSDDLIRNYPVLRSNAEKNVREYYSKTMEERGSERREIHMDEIFRRLQDVYALTEEQTAFLMETERAAEYEESVPVRDNIDKVKCLLAAGETVVLISDMYLPAEDVKRLLKKADPALADIPLFLSSDYGVQKTTGKLFLEVYRSFQPFYDFGRWKHYGDNLFADVTCPRKLGIEAQLVLKPSMNDYETAMAEQIGTHASFLVAALCARFRHEHGFLREQFAYCYVSLYLVPYVCWVIDDALRRGYTSLYFIARDGYHLKRIADAVISERNIPIHTKYLYGSRKAWRLAAMIDDIDEEAWGGGTGSSPRRSPSGNFCRLLR